MRLWKWDLVAGLIHAGAGVRLIVLSSETAHLGWFEIGVGLVALLRIWPLHYAGLVAAWYGTAGTTLALVLLPCLPSLIATSAGDARIIAEGLGALIWGAAGYYTVLRGLLSHGAADREDRDHVPIT